MIALNAPNAGFVVAAYAIAFVVLTGMILATLFDSRALKKRLERAAARAPLRDTRGRDDSE